MRGIPDFSVHLRPPARVRPGEPIHTLAGDPPLQASPQCFRRPSRVMHRRDSFRAAFRYPAFRTIAAWPNAGPSLMRSAALMGF